MSDKYVKMPSEEWARAAEMGADADAVRIDRFRKVPEAKGLFGRTHLGMWEPTLRRCMKECVPAILKGVRLNLGSRHEFAIAIHKIVELSLYVGLGASAGATRNPPLILHKSVVRMFWTFNDWPRLPTVAMEMTEAFSDSRFRTRFSIFVVKCCMIAQDIAIRSEEKFAAAQGANGENRELDGYFWRMSEAAFMTGFEAGYERQTYVRNRSEYGTDEPAVECVPSEEGVGLMRNGGDGKPDREALKAPEDAQTGYDLYNRAVLYRRAKHVKLSNEWFEKSADRGCAEAQRLLGWQYLWGLWSCPKDPRRSECYLRKAAMQGDAMAMLHLGQLYEEDRPGMPRDGKQALKYYKMAANRARIGGAYQGVGRIYEKGIGVPVDIEEAVKWYRLSADASNAWGVHSLHRLGMDTSDYPEYLHHGCDLF